MAKREGGRSATVCRFGENPGSILGTMSSSDASASGPAPDASSSSNTTPPNTNSRSQPSQPGPWLAPPQKPQPLDLSVDRGEAFRVWTRRWESFSRLSRLDTADQQTQHDVFISCVSDDTKKVIDNFPIPTSSRLDVKIILQHLKIYARGQVNDTVKHHNLSKRRQQAGERFEDFLTSIRDLSKTCTFCEPCTELILRDKLLLAVLTLNSVENYCNFHLRTL